MQVETDLRLGELMAHTPRLVQVIGCPVCGTKESRTFFAGPDRLCGTPGTFTYQRCSACATVFQNPRVNPEDLHLCYPGNYYTHLDGPEAESSSAGSALTPTGYRRYFSRFRNLLRRAVVLSVQGTPQRGLIGTVGEIGALSRRMRERAFFNAVDDELLPRDAGQLSALEVGCGSGHLMKMLESVGWKVEGVEWDPTAAEVARRVAGLPVQNGDFRHVELPIGAYNLIVLNHVFEHLDDPLRALQRIEELLAPSGSAVLFYPNPESLGARFFRRFWFAWDVPRHLVLPTVRSLAKAAARVGLANPEVRTRAKDAAILFAHSRAYRDGRALDTSSQYLSHLDSAMAQLEKCLVRLGLRVGEEVVVVLRKGRQRDASPCTEVSLNL